MPETLPSPNPESASVLSTLLERRHGAGTALPDLVDSATPKARSWIEEIQRWLLSHLPKLPSSLHGTQRIFGVILLVFAIVLAVGVIFRFIQGHKTKVTEEIDSEALDAALRAGRGRGSWLEERLAEALARKDFAAAARFRWKLHLLRVGLAPSQTPIEAVSPPESWLGQAYELMFSSRAAPGPSETFRAIELALAAREGRGHE